MPPAHKTADTLTTSLFEFNHIFLLKSWRRLKQSLRNSEYSTFCHHRERKKNSASAATLFFKKSEYIKTYYNIWKANLFFVEFGASS